MKILLTKEPVCVFLLTGQYGMWNFTASFILHALICLCTALTVQSVKGCI